MEDQLSFFPGGLRVMPVDGDTKNTRTATKTLSTLHYPVVATHTTASAGLCTLSSDNMTDVQTVLCDVKKVVSSGFDFRRVVETEHHIPVIYLLSTTEPEQMVAGEDTEFLNHLLLKATYIVRKPLDQAAMAQLWRVVAWRRCCLEERIPGDSMDDIAAHAGVVGKDGNDNDVIIIEEPQVHFKAVRSRGSRKRQLTINVDSGSSDGADANPRQKLEHKKDAKGPLGQHVASHLQPQEYCTKQQKDLDERRLLSSDSLFLKAILPTLNVSLCNPLILTVPAAFMPQDGMTMNKDKAPMIELPFGIPVDDFLVGQTAYGSARPSIGAPDDNDDDAAMYAYTSALNNNAAVGSLMVPPIESTFTIIDPIVGTKGEGSVPVVVVSEDQNNAVAAIEATAPNNAELFMMPKQVAVDAPVDVEEGIMFSLESLLGLDEDMIPMEDAGGEATDGSLNIKEGGMEIGWDLDLDDILMNNTNEFAFLDDLAWIE
uniref:Response regulatory domain-containing protein n=1 Tax=Oryza nivara TaxID=4536 RepID=A0A0E0ICY7_ORYNI